MKYLIAEWDGSRWISYGYIKKLSARKWCVTSPVEAEVGDNDTALLKGIKKMHKAKTERQIFDMELRRFRVTLVKPYVRSEPTRKERVWARPAFS